MSQTIEDKLKESYKPSSGDDVWVDELFADVLAEAEKQRNQDNWYTEVCTRCPYFIDGERTGDCIERLVEASTDDPDAIGATDAKAVRWKKVPLIRCVRPDAVDCLADSVIVTAIVFSLMYSEKQLLESIRERMSKRQQNHKQTQSGHKRNKRIRGLGRRR